jgi:hypothetical protein
VVTEGDGVTTGSGETEAGNGMCTSSRSSISEIMATESAPPTLTASEGMLSKSLGYITSAMYDERSEIGFSVVAYSVSGSDGGMVGNEWCNEMDGGALGMTYHSLPYLALT